MITAELLQNYPLDLRVVVNGTVRFYEDGYDDLLFGAAHRGQDCPELGEASLGRSNMGNLDDLTGGAADCAEVEDALVLRRGSN